MQQTSSTVIVQRRVRKRRRGASGAAATITITCTTSPGCDGWMHVVQACSADELRNVVLRDVEEVAGRLWGGA